MTTRGGSKEPWVTQLAVKPLTSSPSATPQINTPWGILRSKVFLASAFSAMVRAFRARTLGTAVPLRVDGEECVSRIKA